MKKLFILMALSFGLIIAGPQTSVFAASDADAEENGVFSDNILTEVENIMKTTEMNNPNASEEEAFQLAVEKIQEELESSSSNDSQLRSADYGLGSLVNNQLGENEQEVCNSNSYYCSFVLADAVEASNDTQDQFSSGFHNGIADAYRHGYWQARSAFHTGKAYAKAFGDAHEADNPGPISEGLMDDHNNEVGRDIGAAQSFIWQVNDVVMDGINDGDFYYLDDSGLLQDTY